ncbi:MAG: DUF4232 domain-containing protein, partial [Pseudonocardia sp.]|nr:DUF4232 domain-containing protein [Pseudonocardia sp.]
MADTGVSVPAVTRTNGCTAQPIRPSDVTPCAEPAASFGEGGAGAGSQFLCLHLTNRGDRACDLTGCPGVRRV